MENKEEKEPMMKLARLFAHVLKTKVLLTTLVSVAVVGGVTAAAASSPSGQNLVHTMTGTATQYIHQSSAHSPTRTAVATAQTTREVHAQQKDADRQGNANNAKSANNSQTNDCPGAPE